MSGGAPAVTVVMPVLDGARFIGAAMRSIRDQTLEDLELIVVDNGSTDGTADLVRAEHEADRRVRLIELPRPDLVGALNAGLVASRAELVARMDADDLAHPARLAREVAFLATHPEVAVVSCAFHRIDESDRRLGPVRMPTRREGLGELLRHQCLFSSSGALMRRRAVLEVGGFRSTFPTAEDFDLWLRLLDAGHQLENLADELIGYREVATGLTRSYGDRQFEHARRAVVESRLRGLGLPDDRIANIAEDPIRGLASVPGCPAGLRLLVDGMDLEDLATADAAGIGVAAARARPHLTGGRGDRDLALIAYRIATRLRELGSWAAAVTWYLRAFRLHGPLFRALLRRSLGGLRRSSGSRRV